MIDPRFPPQPKKVLIPLYPLKGYESAESTAATLLPDLAVQELDGRVRASFAEGDGRLSFSDSATSSLLMYLRAHQAGRERRLRVALPAYCCPHLCGALVQADFSPVFLDLTDNYQLSIKSIDFAISHQASVLLWPNFFGVRMRNAEVIAYAASRGAEIIFDEAQSFPCDTLSDKFPSLISFGPSKRVQGIGGGGLYTPKDRAPLGHRDPVSVNRCKSSDLPDNVEDPVKTGNFSPPQPRYPHAPLEVELPVLLNKTLKTLDAQPMRDITPLEKVVLLRHLRLLDGHAAALKRLGDALADFVLRNFGRAALHPLKDIVGLPSIFAIRLDGSRRFEIATTLADKGVQTTWYFYPLNLLDAFSRFPAEPMIHTERLASEVLILPFGIGPVTTCLDQYLNILQVGHDHNEP